MVDQVIKFSVFYEPWNISTSFKKALHSLSS